MHTLFDGVAYLCLNELFKHSVDTNYNLTSLDETNASIVQYSSVQSKPALIVRNGGPGSNFCLKQKASQMISLVKYLPLAIGDIYPSDDQHWNCFVLFWAVCYLSLLFEITQEDVGQMQWMVEAFLQSFSALYSGYINFTPKMHQMVHFHEQMTRFGPLRNTWCMRIEAKNKQIKGYVTKNVPFTVGHQHQRSLSYHLANDNFLYAGNEVLGGGIVVLEDSIAFKVSLKLSIDIDKMPRHMLKPNSVKISGIVYKPGLVVRIRNAAKFDYFMIDSVLVHNDIKVFHHYQQSSKWSTTNGQTKWC